MDKIIFHRIAFHPTFRCTLNCELCCSFVPYLEKPAPYYAYDELTSWISRFFEVVDYVDIFSLTGGEPLLYKNLADIIDFVGQYRGQIGRIDLITNGTLLPNNQTLLALKKIGARILLDDYGADLSPKASEVEKVCAACQVNCNRRCYHKCTDLELYHGGWVDFVHFSEVPLSDPREKFGKCTQTGELRCNPVIDGKIYICTPHAFLCRSKKIEDNPGLYIDLSDESTPVKIMREKAADFLSINALPSCAFCNGWLPNSRRVVPARQI